jgi:hypothetical protein
MRAYEWLRFRRRRVIAAAAGVMVAVAVGVTATAASAADGRCNVDSGPLKVCIVTQGDIVSVGSYANPVTYEHVKVVVDFQGAVRDGESLITRTYADAVVKESMIVLGGNGRFAFELGSWKAGAELYGLHSYKARIFATPRRLLGGGMPVKPEEQATRWVKLA